MDEQTNGRVLERIGRHTNNRADIHTNRRTDKLTDSRTEVKETGRKIYKQTDRQEQEALTNNLHHNNFPLDSIKCVKFYFDTTFT